MRRKKLLRQVAAAAVALSMAVSLSAPAFAAEFNLANGGLVITADERGITVKQDGQKEATSIADNEEIVVTGTYKPAGEATLTAEENRQDENQPVTPAKAPAKEKTSEETSEETQEAENAPAAEEKQEQKDTENLTDPEQKTETENKDNNSDPADEEKKEQNAPANGEQNASADEGQEPKAEEKPQPKPEAKASAEATASASDDASNGSRKAPARSSGEGERTGIIQIFNNTVDKLVKLTLHNATIDQPGQAGTSARGTAAIDIQGEGDVRITVKGDNLLTGKIRSAAIQKNDDVSTGKLTITAQDTNQKLTVKEGGGGVAIGGEGYTDEHSGEGTKNIEINNGTLTVEGAIGSKEGNATGIKITGDAVVNVTGDIRGSYKNYNDDSECTTEIEISGKAQVNVKKIDDNGYSWGGDIGQSFGKNEKITISGNAKVNTEGCIGDFNAEYGSKNGLVNISDNATVNAEGGIAGDNSTVNISNNATVKANVRIGGKDSTVNISNDANVTANGYLGGGYDSTNGKVTISNNAQVKSDRGLSISCNLTLKDQAKLEGEIYIDKDKLTKNETSDGAVLDAYITSKEGESPSRTRQVKEDGEWKDVSDKLNGSCTHEKTYLSETIPPTCSTPGEKIYRCFYCGREVNKEPVACLLHTWVKGETVAPTCTQKGYTVYKCSVCGQTENRDTTDALGHEYKNGVCTRCGAPEPQENGSAAPNYTVTGAETYETSVVDGRYIIAVPSEDAALNAVLGDLRAIKAQGADVVVFRTRSRESSLVIDEMLAMGTDVTPFVLAHSGSEARLTINGEAHNELIH